MTVKARSAYTINNRPTTLRDARKLNLVAVCDHCAECPGQACPDQLALVTQGILAALTGTRREGESDTDYIARVLADSKKQVIDAANEGSRIHDAIERSFRGMSVPEQYLPHVQSARLAIAKQYPNVTDWVTESSFSHPSGYGGRCDLHSPSTGIVIDYKTKDWDFSDGKKLAYEQHYQLGAYQAGFNLRQAPGMALFVSRTHPGSIAFHEWSAEDMQQGYRIFCGCLSLWKLTKGFNPGWQE